METKQVIVLSKDDYNIIKNFIFNVNAPYIESESAIEALKRATLQNARFESVGQRLKVPTNEKDKK